MVVPDDVGGVVGAIGKVKGGVEIAFSDDGHAEVLGVPFVGRVPFAVADPAVYLFFNVSNPGNALAIHRQCRLGTGTHLDVFPSVLGKGVGVRGGSVGDGGGESGSPLEGNHVGDNGLAATVIGYGECDIVIGDTGEVGLYVFAAGGRGAAPGEGPVVGEVIAIGVGGHSHEVESGLVVIALGDDARVPGEVGFGVTVVGVGWGGEVCRWLSGVGGGGRRFLATAGHADDQPNSYDDD